MGFDPVELEKNITYSDDILFYLQSKWDEGTHKCFQIVAESADNPYGLLRTKIPDFKENRRMYDLGFTILEAQGFIHAEEMGNMRPYFLTVRGKQLLKGNLFNDK